MLACFLRALAQGERHHDAVALCRVSCAVTAHPGLVERLAIAYNARMGR
jgi:hypothetical protein